MEQPSNVDDRDVLQLMNELERTRDVSNAPALSAEVSAAIAAAAAAADAPNPAAVEPIHAEVFLVRRSDNSPSGQRRSTRLEVATHSQEIDGGAVVLLDIHLTPTSADRKRRRINPKSPAAPNSQKTPGSVKKLRDDEDDGSTCPICLDSWEMSGEHRLISLKCGHLFGESCIRRWFAGVVANQRSCPSCKTHSSLRDIRAIYAKRVSAVDKSEEYRLQQLLTEETQKVGALSQQLSLLQLSLEVQQKFNAKLESQLEEAKMTAINLNVSLMNASQSHAAPRAPRQMCYKMSRECTINICPEPGCRVLIHSQRTNNLIVSQKSVQHLFPGFGVRFVDLPSYRLTSFLHMAQKQIRDLTFDASEQMLAAASMDRTCKVYNINNRGCVATFTPSDKPIWSVAFDRAANHSVYFGTQNGSTYRYDVRQPATPLEEYKSDGMSPVISICSVLASQPDFPFGGFLVCQLQSLHFYEFTDAQQLSTTATKLALVGPFVSMSYEPATRTLLVATRPTTAQPHSQLYYAELRKVGAAPAPVVVVVDVVSTMLGSRVQAVMSRSAQLRVDDTALVAAYMQDTKVLQTWQVRAAEQKAVRQQQLPIDDCVLDLCPIYGAGGGGGGGQEGSVFLGALSESKCRIYKVYGDGA